MPWWGLDWFARRAAHQPSQQQPSQPTPTQQPLQYSPSMDTPNEQSQLFTQPQLQAAMAAAAAPAMAPSTHMMPQQAMVQQQQLQALQQVLQQLPQQMQQQPPHQEQRAAGWTAAGGVPQPSPQQPAPQQPAPQPAPQQPAQQPSQSSSIGPRKEKKARRASVKTGPLGVENLREKVAIPLGLPVGPFDSIEEHEHALSNWAQSPSLNNVGIFYLYHRDSRNDQPDWLKLACTCARGSSGRSQVGNQQERNRPTLKTDCQWHICLRVHPDDNKCVAAPTAWLVAHACNLSAQLAKDMAQFGMTRHDLARLDTTWHGLARLGTA